MDNLPERGTVFTNKDINRIVSLLERYITLSLRQGRTIWLKKKDLGMSIS